MKTTAPNPDWPKVVCCWFAFRIKRAKKFQHLDLKCFRVMVCIDNTFRFSSCTSTVQPTTKYVMKTLPAMHNCTFHFFAALHFLLFFFFKYLHFQKRFKIATSSFRQDAQNSPPVDFNRFEILVGTQNKTFVLQTFANSSKDLRPSELC